MAELRSPVCNFDTQKFKNNEEALELRKIFNIIEENKLKKAKEIKKIIFILKKMKIKKI